MSSLADRMRQRGTEYHGNLGEDCREAADRIDVLEAALRTSESVRDRLDKIAYHLLAGEPVRDMAEAWGESAYAESVAREALGEASL